MRSAFLALIGLALLGLIGWLLLSSGSSTPEGGGPDAAQERTDRPRAAPQRGDPNAVPRRELERPTERPAPQPPSQTQETANPARPHEAEAGNLELVVVDRATRAPLEQFSAMLWRGGSSWTRVGEHGRLALQAPFDQDFEVVLEAKGYVPSGKIVLQVTSAERKRSVTVELDKAMAGTGVVLTVVDAAQSPVPRLVVVAWRRGDDGEPRGPRLWERRTEQADGVYALPDLQPGRYLVQVTACDELGDPTTLQPERLSFDLSGSENLPLRVVLKAGAQLRIQLVDSAGQPAVPQGAVGAWLEQDGRKLETRWQSRSGNSVARSIGMLQAAESMLVGAIAPGAYRLVVRATAEYGRDLVLRAGATEKIEITLR